jgi:N-acetylglucosamine-6-phosphate deacetylase
MQQVLPLLNRRKGNAKTGAEILGAHIEGPFISVLKKGAHKQSVFRDAKNGIKDFDDAYGSELKKGSEAISIITMAPEIEGVCDAIPDLVARGITVSIGHSACRIAEAEKAVTKGANSITHLFNAMQAVSRFIVDTEEWYDVCIFLHVFFFFFVFSIVPSS